MRHIVLALMIALLPVRGWVGGTMAIGMQAPPADTAASTGGMSPECPMLKAMSRIAPDDDAAQTLAVAGQCELCLQIVVPDAPVIGAGGASGASLPRGTAAHFVSARLAPPLAIPIS